MKNDHPVPAYATVLFVVLTAALLSEVRLMAADGPVYVETLSFPATLTASRRTDARRTEISKSMRRKPISSTSWTVARPSLWAARRLIRSRHDRDR